MELAKGGEVFDKLIEYGSLSEPEAAKLLAQVIFMANSYMLCMRIMPIYMR